MTVKLKDRCSADELEPQYKIAVCMCSSARSRGSASHSSSQSRTTAEEILLLCCEPQVLGTSGRAAVLSLHLLRYREHPPGCVVLQNKKEVGSFSWEGNKKQHAQCS